MSHVKIKDFDNFVKDPSTGAVLNTDQSILMRRNSEIEAMRKEARQEHKINSIEKDLAEIKELLRKLVS
jgi:hypothetical protein